MLVNAGWHLALFGQSWQHWPAYTSAVCCHFMHIFHFISFRHPRQYFVWYYAWLKYVLLGAFRLQSRCIQTSREFSLQNFEKQQQQQPPQRSAAAAVAAAEKQQQSSSSSSSSSKSNSQGEKTAAAAA